MIWWRNIFNPRAGTISGAAFLMATSAVGPGFITQTTVFTIDLLYDFGFVILISVLVDIIVQLNIWRIVMQRRQNAAVIAGEVVKGGGHLLAAMVVLGGLVFNIGNISGCGLGLQALFGMDVIVGAAVSGLLAISLFAAKYFGKVLDTFTKVLGIVMLLIIGWIAIVNLPPAGPVLSQAVWPADMHYLAILTLVGGTVGGYISFAGAHRLLDSGDAADMSAKQVNRQAIAGIVLAALVRIGLYVAILGVLVAGFAPDMSNPTASIFEAALGANGRRIFGVILWCASVTSVVGASYTSVSFLNVFGSWFHHHRQWLIGVFIAASTIIFLFFGKPVKVLVIAGAINALVLPFGLGIMLLAAGNAFQKGGYRHPKWLLLSGWFVVAAVCTMVWQAFAQL